MAIKKRGTAPVDQEKIEAFGAAADVPASSDRAPILDPGPEPAPAVRTAAKTPAGEWPTDVPKSLLIRWPDAALAVELAAVAALEDRSQHKTAIRAMQRGLEVLRAEHRD